MVLENGPDLTFSKMRELKPQMVRMCLNALCSGKSSKVPRCQGLLGFGDISDAASQLQEVSHTRWVWKQMWSYFPVLGLVDPSQKANPTHES